MTGLPVPVRVVLASVPSDAIDVLMDSHRIAFMKLYDETHLWRDLAKARAAEALAGVELFPLVVDNHEDYLPGDH